MISGLLGVAVAFPSGPTLTLGLLGLRLRYWVLIVLAIAIAVLLIYFSRRGWRWQ